ncbi:Zf-met2 domain-containing protein [Balamuthia mandrillaris]
MGKQNGQRAQQKRERNAKKTAAKTKGASQLKSNEKAKTIQCQICKQTFLCTTKAAELKSHAEGRHTKLPLEQAFPDIAQYE